MKTYIFITRRICEIGGAEQYLYNKTRYLKSIGWRVFVFSGRKGNILIEGLKEYEDGIIPALTYAPECYSKRIVRKTVSGIAKKVGVCDGSPCIVESDSVNRAVWAELVAKQLGAKHLAFILSESHNYPNNVRAFLRFKYDRHELAGITALSINQMLGDDTVEQRPDTKITAYCSNVVEDCPDTITPQLDAAADHTFGSLGRLEKPCVPAILKGFKAYFTLHPGEKFNLVLIGGAVFDNKIEQVLAEMSECENVKVILTGNMYPIPTSLVNQIEVFVSTAGSATATYRAHRPTVRVHPTTGNPVGITGLDYDIREKTMYDETPGLTIEDCIRRALLYKDQIQYVYGFDDDYHAEFDRQVSFADIDIPQEYYSEKQLLQIRTTHVHRHFIRWLIGHLIGGEGINRLEDIKRRNKKNG